jgi:hypothetical protein
MTSQFHPRDDAGQCNRTTADCESSSVCNPRQRAANEKLLTAKVLQTAMRGTVAGLLTAAESTRVATPGSGTDHAQPR